MSQLHRRHTRLLGLGTSTPPHSASQEHARAFMSRVLSEELDELDTDALIWKLEAIFENSGIERRHTCIEDYLRDDPSAFEFFPKNWGLAPAVGTRQRMEKFREAVLDMSERAAREALDQAGVAAEDVSHIVFCTCTGFFAPGPDVLLAKRLGIPSTADRTQVGFMGCYAGFSGMRVADRVARTEPDGVVLQISAELCTLHFQTTPDTETIVANCLFADGCGAAVYSTSDQYGEGLAEIKEQASDVGQDSLDQMGWEIGNHGFEMTLSSKVPDTLGQKLPSFVDAMLDSAGVARSDVHNWAFHPGGRKIVESGANALGLEPDTLASAFEVLRDYGNMSSATIFFVLQRELARTEAGSTMVALGFGPGLTVEGAVLERV
ncbi:MAG: type III polyketide synthase [Myxococcota bacterium]